MLLWELGGVAVIIIMEWVIFILVFLIVGGICSSISEANKEAKRKQIIAQNEKEKKELMKKRLAVVTSEREKKYGQLTKTIPYSYNVAYDMQIYETSKTVFIEGKPYSFADILSCRIETTVIKGKETHVTTPDKGHKYNMQALYGSNWEKHITKYNTEIIKEPDITHYSIYIGLNNLTNPIIKIELGDNNMAASEICAVLQVLVKK